MLCPLNFTDDVSEPLLAPKFIKFPVRYFYLLLRKKKITSLTSSGCFHYHTSSPHY